MSQPDGMYFLCLLSLSQWPNDEQLERSVQAPAVFRLLKLKANEDATLTFMFKSMVECYDALGEENPGFHGEEESPNITRTKR